MRLAGLVIALCLVVGAAAVAIGVDLGNRSAAAGPGASVTVVAGSPLLDRPAPDFTLEDLSGEPVRLSDYRGRPVLVNFWASWCEPCKVEFPLFEAARQRYAGTGLEILGVVHNDSAEAAAAFVAEEGAEWPTLLDPDDAVWDAYGGLGVPTTFFIDREGVVRAVSYGPPLSGSLDKQLDKIL